MKRRNGEYSLTITTTKSVIMRDLRTLMMAKMFTVVAKTKMQPRSSLPREKSPGRKETRSLSRYVLGKLLPMGISK
jgi:hypothetical protein